MSRWPCDSSVHSPTGDLCCMLSIPVRLKWPRLILTVSIYSSDIRNKCSLPRCESGTPLANHLAAWTTPLLQNISQIQIIGKLTQSKLKECWYISRKTSRRRSIIQTLWHLKNVVVDRLVGWLTLIQGFRTHSCGMLCQQHTFLAANVSIKAHTCSSEEQLLGQVAF